MSWYDTMFRKDPEYYLKNDKKVLGINIYNAKKTGDHIKKFHIIHYVFKYKFLVPLILLGNKILGKHIVTKVDNESHNRNLKIFDKSFESAITKWCTHYRRNSGPQHLRKSDKYWKKVGKREIPLRSLKNYVLTMCMYDTAYREFLNVWMHESARAMVDEYSKYPNKSTGHLFFTTDVYDVHYYILEKAIRYNTEIGISDAKKLIDDYYIYQEALRNAKRAAKNKVVLEPGK